jgi:hypothetical protein
LAGAFFRTFLAVVFEFFFATFFAMVHHFHCVVRVDAKAEGNRKRRKVQGDCGVSRAADRESG